MKTIYKDIKESVYKYQRSKKWLLARIYNAQKNNWMRKRNEWPEYSLEELRNIYLNDSIYNKLHDEWVESWYSKMLSPSLDRINPMIWYTLDNIQMVTYWYNLQKWHDEMWLTQWKRVLQKKDWVIIWKYISISDAGRKCKINFRNISNCLLWKRCNAWWYQREYDKKEIQRLWEAQRQ